MRILLLVVLSAMAGHVLKAQTYKKEEAKAFFVNQRYEDALSVLKSANALVSTDQEARFILAVCYYQTNDLEQAAQLFKSIVREEKDPFPECWLYLGKIRHAMNQFSEAVDYYKDYLRRIRSNHPNRKMVWDDIRRCATGMRLQYLPSEVYAENLGLEVNGSGDEFAPVPSPNYSNRLYFSSMRNGNLGGRRDENGMPDSRTGQFYSDIYSCRSATGGGGSWQEVRSVGYLVNSTRHDVLFDFNADGRVLYFFQGWRNDDAKIRVDTFQTDQEDRTVSSDVFKGPIAPTYGDEAFFFASDYLVYFASRRPGGYGGLDLYRLEFKEGAWGEPVNLGPQINTSYDETTPFLARDRMTLYYSTNHPDLSIGGLDVVKSVFNPNSETWTLPENLLTKINSSEDDAYFRIAKDGFTGFFASSRKDGYGQRDLYAAHFENFLPEMELRVDDYSGNVESKLVEPEITGPPEDMAASLDAEVTEVPNAEIQVPKVGEKPAPELPAIGEELPVEPQLTTDIPVIEEGAEIAGIFLPPFYLKEEASPALSDKQDEQLQEITDIMRSKTDAYLILTAYQRTVEDSKGKVVFTGVQQAKGLGEVLQDKGVPADRIFIRGLLSDEAAETECGVDFSFYLPEGQAATTELPVIGLRYANAVPEHPVHERLLYKVQVGALSGAYNTNSLDAYENVMVERQLDGPYYRYTVGAFTSFTEAEAFKTKLLEGAFSSAYVVAYIDGRRADQMRARRHIIDFPDLKAYTD
ncbi:MAG: tetratricopeptide repeat protein [Phaeodactylibacter sp.]|uniref:SPOR domain-containing protein n=1 Tax=Phaeodactylibacter sp. TaxID=1940289 RepID=UPI0032EE0678